MLASELQAATQAASQTAETAAVQPPRKEKVAILGFVGHYQKAPFDDPSFEIWGLNELYQFIPRWDRWFELHQRAVYENDRQRTSEHITKLKAMTCPVYMHQHWDDIPASVPYPLPVVMQTFANPCPEARPYLTNSITYMILLAILEGFKEIQIYGVDMSHDCLAPDMRVLTADLRWVRAGDLTLGQELLAFDEEIPLTIHSGPAAQFRKYRKTTVESLSRINRPCYRLRMGDGSTLISSEGHKWLTIGGAGHNRVWQDTKVLQPRSVYPQRTSHIVKLMETWEEMRSWEAGYTAAAFDGEGHVSQGDRPNTTSTHMSIGFAQRHNEMSRQVEDCMSYLGFEMTGYESAEGCIKYGVRGTRAELLRFLGAVRPRRLLEKFDADKMGTLNCIGNIPVIDSEFIGEQEVVGLQTGTRTLIVEGFASHNSEYGSQRPSCEWAVGLAAGRGIKVYIPPESDLLKTVFLYGYEQDGALAFDSKLKQQESEYKGNIEKINAELNRLGEVRAQYQGALQHTQHMRTNWRSLHQVPTTSS